MAVTESARKSGATNIEATLYEAVVSGTPSDMSSSNRSSSIEGSPQSRVPNGKNVSLRRASSRSTRPLSSNLMRALSGLCCQECSVPGTDRDENQESSANLRQDSTFDEYEALTVMQDSVVSPLVLEPMMMDSSRDVGSLERIIGEYIASCKFYGCQDRVNAGVLTSLRFSLPALRVSGSFHDADMLALGEILLRHCNGALRHVKRLDFSVAAKEGKGENGKPGFQSHGAFTLSKVLQSSRYIQEVFLQRNKIGPYGACALYVGVSTNPTLRVLNMRGCRAGERGAMAFAQHVCRSKACGLEEVDLSANRIGFMGTKAIERELAQRNAETDNFLAVDMEGNLIFQEVMNGVTHGLGILLAVVGSFVLSDRVKDAPTRNVVSCSIYSTSLLVLYTSSTLYHSFFSLRATRYIFQVFDKCAIYILIAGSYTPFCVVLMKHYPPALYLLIFIWICAIMGVSVEAILPTWKHKRMFSLAMYLGTGWAATVCLPGIVGILPRRGVNLMIMGGVGYTTGVPFFVRNHNLDHSIWHVFVLTASMFHWFCVYFYVATME